MSARDPNDLLKNGGGEIGDLYRRLPRYEPPKRLDRAVLNEAARAVHSGKPPRRQRWIVAVGSAAGLVLAAGLAWRIGHEPMSSTNDTAAPAAAPRVVPVQPIDESARAKREAPAREEAPPPAAAPPSVEQRAAGAVSKRNDQPKASQKQRAEPRPAPPPAEAEAPPPPASAPPPQPFSANEQDAGEAKDAAKMEGLSAGSSGAPSTLTTQSADRARLRRASPTLPSSSVELQGDMRLAPRDWLAHLRELMQQGRRQQATESLRLFVRTHPDERVPQDLRELLE